MVSTLFDTGLGPPVRALMISLTVYRKVRRVYWLRQPKRR
jgi:hypothetical protein